METRAGPEIGGLILLKLRSLVRRQNIPFIYDLHKIDHDVLTERRTYKVALSLR